MLTDVVPAALLYGYTEEMLKDLLVSPYFRHYLITKIYEAEDPKWKRSGTTRFFTFDKLTNEGVFSRLRVTGWLGSFQPEKVISIPTLTAIDVVRDLYSAYPLFSEGFQLGVPKFVEGHVAGVFSRAR